MPKEGCMYYVFLNDIFSTVSLFVENDFEKGDGVSGLVRDDDHGTISHER